MLVKRGDLCKCFAVRRYYNKGCNWKLGLVVQCEMVSKVSKYYMFVTTKLYSPPLGRLQSQQIHYIQNSFCKNGKFVYSKMVSIHIQYTVYHIQYTVYW